MFSSLSVRRREPWATSCGRPIARSTWLGSSEPEVQAEPEEAHMPFASSRSRRGTAGLVGQIMTWQTMTAVEPPMVVLVKIIVMQIALPAVVTLLISEFMRKKKWIQYGDMKLEL